MATRAEAKPKEEDLARRFAAVRALSREIAAPLSDADATVQPHPDASPAKWHLAHTTWFFETFVLRDHGHAYRPRDERWSFLFNSYYDGEGERQPRARRACSAARRSRKSSPIEAMSTPSSSGGATICRERHVS
jgi:hypothetical protein